MNNYQEDIAKTWDNINECLIDKTKAISHEDFMRAKAGELEISLAGIKTVPKEWFPNKRKKYFSFSMWWRTTSSCICCTWCKRDSNRFF